MSKRRRKTFRALLYCLPLLLFAAFALVLATALGDYTVTWKGIVRLLNAIEPGHELIGDYGVTLYQLTQASRKIAHVLLYAGLSALVVRTLQWGRPRLRWRTILVTILLAGGFLLAENVVRARSPGRHVRAAQLVWNGIGVATTLSVTLVYFGIKSLERRLGEPETPATE